mgnify:CR=1 FL=1
MSGMGKENEVKSVYPTTAASVDERDREQKTKI